MRFGGPSSEHPPNNPFQPIAPENARSSRTAAWAAGMNMSSERHHPLTFPRKRHGAGSAGAFDHCAAITVTSRFYPVVVATLAGFALLRSVGAASIGARLFLSSCRRVRVASQLAVQCDTAARSDSTGLLQAQLHRSGQWPNNSLVPTPVTNAPLLSVSSGAAHLKR